MTGRQEKMTSNLALIDPQKWITSDHAVESFQIAVPGGDCSIHLLLKDIPESTEEHWNSLGSEEYTKEEMRTLANLSKRGKLVSAVLVDGGYDGGMKFGGETAAKAIEEAIIDLKGTFGDEFRFTSWVVTHWDRDHYSGSLRMILEDLHKNYQNKARENRPMNLTDATKSNRVQSSYFRYDEKDGSCLTTLYSPYFDNPNWARAKKGKPKGAHWMLTRNPQSEDLVDFLLLASNEDGTGRHLEQKRTTKKSLFSVKLPGICRKCEGYENLAGVDFFSVHNDPTWQKLKIGQGREIYNEQISFTDLLKLIPGSQPRFLCVGAEGYILGEPMTQIVKRPSEATLENFISIVSLIVWPPKQGSTDSGRVSYFTGGDSYNENESKLAQWLSGTPVRVIKASHHGARSSTPSAMLEKMKPSKVIISAGLEYGHPSKSVINEPLKPQLTSLDWTILALLYAYSRGMTGNKEGLAYTLRHPYYLNTEIPVKRTVDLNMKHKLPKSGLDLMDSSKLQIATLANKITTQYKKSWQEAGNFTDWHVMEVFAFCNAFKVTEHANTPFVQSFLTNLTNHTSASKILLYISVLNEFWNAISPVQKKYATNGSNEVLFLWTRHSDHDWLDGRVSLIEDWVQFCGGSNPNNAVIQENGNLEHSNSPFQSYIANINDPETSAPSRKKLKLHDKQLYTMSDWSEMEFAEPSIREDWNIVEELSIDIEDEKTDKKLSIDIKDEPHSDLGKPPVDMEAANGWGQPVESIHEFVEVPDNCLYDENPIQTTSASQNEKARTFETVVRRKPPPMEKKDKQKDKKKVETKVEKKDDEEPETQKKHQTRRIRDM